MSPENQKPKFCFNCGEKIKDDYIYCPYCGKYCKIPDSNKYIVKKEINSEYDMNYQILSCLKEIQCNTGRKLLSQILQGSKSQVITNTKTYENKYYGILGSYYSDKIISFIDNLIQQGFIESYKSDRRFGRPLVRLTSKGEQFLID